MSTTTIRTADLARRWHMKPASVKRIAPVTLIGGKRRYLLAKIEEFEASNTFSQQTRRAADLPWRKSSLECLAELNAP